MWVWAQSKATLRLRGRGLSSSLPWRQTSWPVAKQLLRLWRAPYLPTLQRQHSSQGLQPGSRDWHRDSQQTKPIGTRGNWFSCSPDGSWPFNYVPCNIAELFFNFYGVSWSIWLRQRSISWSSGNVRNISWVVARSRDQKKNFTSRNEPVNSTVLGRLNMASFIRGVMTVVHFGCSQLMFQNNIVHFLSAMSLLAQQMAEEPPFWLPQQQMTRSQ